MLLEQVELDFATESVTIRQLARDFMIVTVLGEGPLGFLEARMVAFMQINKSQFGGKTEVKDL